MLGELQPITEAGKRFVALAEEHAADFATRAAEHDREGSFPHENFDAMKKSGFVAAFVPEELGGLGVSSIHDFAVGMSRLGRGDGSTAIAVNMHLAATIVMQRIYAQSLGPEGSPLGALVGGLLRGVAGGQVLAAVFGTEAGTALSYPQAEAVLDGDGYVLNGKKIFGTLSPAATIYFVPVRVKRDDGAYAAGMATLTKGMPGVEIRDNWDAMGMRASGSGDVALTDVRLSRGSVAVSDGVLGASSPDTIDRGISGNIGLIAVFTGIAETAASLAVDLAKSRRKGPSDRTMAERHWMQTLVGEMMVDLETCRGMLAQAGRRIDEWSTRTSAPDTEALFTHFAQFQAAKYVVNRKAIDVVDKALTISGGAGYMSKHPLSRLYRDVRAGPFMQPFSPPEALQLVGRVTLGQEAEVEL